MEIIENSEQNSKEDLIKAKDLLEKVFQSLDSALFILDNSKPPAIIECNPAASKIFGYEREEMLGKTTEFLHLSKEILSEFQQIVYPIIEKQGYLSSFEFLMKRKNGEVFPTEHSILSLHDNKGMRTGWVSIVKDVTERKIIEDELRKSEERYKRMVSAVTAYTYSVEINKGEAISTHHSIGCVPVTGYHPEDFEKNPFLWHAMIYPDDKTIVENTIREVLSGHTVLPIEHRLIRSDGTTVWIRNTMVPYHDLEGHLIRYDGLIEDISERKQAEDAMRESEARFRAIVEAFDGLIYICSQDYRIEFMNQRLIERTGYNPIGDLCYKALHDRDSICPWCVNERVFKGEIVRWEVQSPKDDQWYYVVNTPIHHIDGTMSKQAMILDITERKLAEENIEKLNRELEEKINELTEKNKELKAFNYSVSHDLRIPLVVIEGFTSRLQKAYESKFDSREKDMLRIIHTQTQKMKGLIRDLLAFSVSGRQQIQSTEIDMNNLVANVLNELKPLINGRTIRFDIKDLSTAYGDRVLIRQVLINLLSNAIKFTKPKDVAVIEVGSKVEENEIIYYLRDNGVGFNPQDAKRLFSPFQRLHDSKEFPGTGLGLSIVQRIINRHGGRVWAEGKVNEGAIIYFSLPKK